MCKYGRFHGSPVSTALLNYAAAGLIRLRLCQTTGNRIFYFQHIRHKNVDYHGYNTEFWSYTDYICIFRWREINQIYEFDIPALVRVIPS